MKRALVAFDWWLIHRVEAASHGIQKWSGWDCFQQARVCYAVASLAQILMLLTLVGLPVWLVITLSIAVYMPTSLWYAFIATRGGSPGEKWARFLLEAGLSNPMKVDGHFRMLRLSVLAVTLYLYALRFAQRPMLASVTFILVATYLQACDPLPPSKGKIREWWNSLGKQLVPVRA